MQAERRYFTANVINYLAGQDNLTYNKNVQFVNNTPIDVWVLDRDNTPVRVSGNNSLHIPGDSRGFIIRETHNFFDFEHMEKVKAAIEYISTKNSSQGTSRSAIYNKLCEALKDPSSKFANITMDYFISLEDLRNSQAIHDKSTGYTVTVNNKHLIVNNPESKDSETQGEVDEYITNRPNGLLFEIVDNTDTIKERFIFSGNQVIKIPVIKSVSRESGLYVTSVRDFGNDKSETITTPFILSTQDGGAKFAEGEKKYGLFRTREEALTHGHPENISNSRMEEMVQQTKIMEQQTKVMEHEHKRQVLQWDAEKRNMVMEHEAAMNRIAMDHKQQLNALETQAKARDEEIARLKDEIEKRKVVRNDYYESRSSERKDNSELIKYVPALLIGALGVFALARR